MKSKLLRKLSDAALIKCGIVCGGTVVTLSAHGDVVGLQVHSSAAPINGGVVELPGPGPMPPGGPRTLFRIYAEFTNQTDRVNVWGVGGDMGWGAIENINASGTAMGAGFTNVGGSGGQLRPYSPGSTRDWDSYMTIGILYSDSIVGGTWAQTLPGTPAFIGTGATSWPPDASTGGGVFVPSNAPQGVANFSATQFPNGNNDNEFRVLLMQLVVNIGEHVKGTIGLNWSVHGVAGTSSNVTGLTFNSIPAPGSLGILALAAALVAPRRRRR